MTSITKVLSVEHAQGTGIVAVQALMNLGAMPLRGTIVLAFPDPETAAAVGKEIIREAQAQNSEPYAYEESFTAPDGEKVILNQGRVFPVRGKGDFIQ
jgi:hypothetical protein